MACVAASEICGAEPRPLRHAGEHARPDLLVVVEREYEVRPPRARQCAVGSRLAFGHPADPLKSCKHPS